MGILSGSIPWYTMMVLHKKWSFMQRIDDTLGVFHTHAVAGLLGGATTGLFAEPVLCNLFLPSRTPEVHFMVVMVDHSLGSRSLAHSSSLAGTLLSLP